MLTKAQICVLLGNLQLNTTGEYCQSLAAGGNSNEETRQLEGELNLAGATDEQTVAIIACLIDTRVVSPIMR